MKLTPALLAAILTMTLALPAAAFGRGIVGQSGVNNTDCTACHRGNTPVPTVSVVDFPTQMTVGDDVLFTVVVRSNDGTGGRNGCPNRCAGFNASTDRGGSFVAVAGAGTQVNGTDVAHDAPKPFVGSEASFAVHLTSLVAGNHTLFIAGNDTDGSGTGGDRPTTVRVAFAVAAAPGAPAPVGEPPAPPPDEPAPGTAVPADPNDVDAGSPADVGGDFAHGGAAGGGDGGEAVDGGGPQGFEVRDASCASTPAAGVAPFAVLLVAIAATRLHRRRRPALSRR